MNYAKFKNSTTIFIEVDNNLVGRSVFIYNESAAISTVKVSNKWFGDRYERCEEKDFKTALEQAKKMLYML